ncbi:MAG: hypothetical protein JXR36_01700 [Bacteroidales bacterium]|nr:hypothetical protein [Bacteroidales bacterium]
MKTKTVKILTIFCLTYFIINSETIHAQKYNPIDVFKEMPDSLLKFSNSWMPPLFLSDMRSHLLSKKHIDHGTSSYSEIDSDVINSENTETEQPNNYYVILNLDVNWIKIKLEKRHYEATLDFFLIPEFNSYSIVLLEQYSEYFLPSETQTISKYYFDKSKMIYIESAIQIPNISWSDFFSQEELVNLNMYYLADIEIHPEILILKSDNQLACRILPNQNEVIKEFYGTMDHIYTDYQNQFEDIEMIKDSLGFNLIAEPTPLYYSFPNFNLLDNKQYELIYLYNSFCEKHSPELNLSFDYDDKTNDWQILAEDIPHSLEFKDSIMNIKSQMMNNIEINSILLKINQVDYFAMCYNTIGFMSDSQLRVFEREGLSLKKEVSLDTKKLLTNENFGIDYPENVFDKFPSIFKAHYKVEGNAVLLSLLINPPIGDKEAEDIINQISNNEIVLEIKLEELF